MLNKSKQHKLRFTSTIVYIDFNTSMSKGVFSIQYFINYSKVNNKIEVLSFI
jgi:hypothetical protein